MGERILDIHLVIEVAVINFAAALLQASTGFGYAILAMSLMPLILPMRYCSAVSAVTVVVIGLQMVSEWSFCRSPVVC